MQDKAMSKWLSPLMAFCLSFLIIATLAPITGIQIDRQLDFWILWLVTMLILALPICYLEIALAKRSKTTALQALSKLTRDADASQRWRLVGWMGVVFIPFLAGAMLLNTTNVLSIASLDVSTQIIFVVAAVIALALSVLPRQILVLLTAIGVFASIVLANVMGTALPAWQVTPVEFSEWGSATVLALVASGLGMGLYWQSSLAVTAAEEQVTKSALPIWIAQLIAVIAFAFFAVNSQVPAFTLVVATLAATALILNMAREQLRERQLNVVIQWAVVAVPLLLWVIPNSAMIFNPLLLVWGLVICLIYAVFAGWIMKISHLRKSLNFSSEVFYNIWRIAVRVVLPLSIIVAIISVIGSLI